MPEIIMLGHLSRLVIASQQEDLARELNFEGKDVGDNLGLALPAIDIVAEEEDLLVCSAELLSAQQLY